MIMANFQKKLYLKFSSLGLIQISSYLFVIPRIKRRSSNHKEKLRENTKYSYISQCNTKCQEIFEQCWQNFQKTG